jgi:uncharacterized membrane protein
MIIELGALLGALLATYAMVKDPAPDTDIGTILIAAPALGALWGAAIGATIHFIANGAAFGWIMALVGFFLHR